MHSIQFVAAALALLGTPASAFWRMECRGSSGTARIDPIMKYGSVGGHVHEIFGGQAFSEVADSASLIGSNCTSCAVTADKSAYWTPIPYFQDDATGEWETVANVGGMLAYYFLNGNPEDTVANITAFPTGFQMVAGDSNRRNYTVGDSSYEDPDPGKSEWAALNQTSQEDLAQRAIGFNCLDYTKAAEGSLYRHFLPSKDYIDAYCPDGIRAELMFPSCWDGVNLDSEDHKSHVAYPSLVINGECPDTHPVRLPGLFYETIWDMGSSTYSNRSGIFAFSNGDPLGFGYHGDFIMGWEQTNFTLQEAVDSCTNLSGEIEDCPLFTVISEAEQNQCHFDMPTVLANEDIDGPLASLPGDVSLAWGPGPADAAASGSESSTTVTMPTLSYTPGVTATNNGSVVPGNIFKITPTTTTTTEPGVTDAAATTDAAGSVITLATSTYTYSGASGDVTISEIVIEEAVTWVTEMTTTTVLVSEPTAAARLRHRDAHAHAHQHRYAGRKH